MRIPATEGPAERPGALPSVSDRRRVTPELLARGQESAALGAAAGNVGVALFDAATRLQEREDVELVLRATVGVQDDATAWTLKAREQRGINAHGATPAAEEWWSERVRSASEALTTDRQRRMFEQRVLPARAGFMTNIATWESQQRQASLSAATTATAVSAVNSAAANHDNPEAVAQSLRTVVEMVELQGRNEGWVPEVLAARRAEAKTGLFTQVIRSFVANGRLTQAEAFYRANMDSIAGTARPEIERLFRDGSDLARTQLFVDGLLRQNLTDTQMREAISAEFTGQARGMAVTELNSRIATRETERRRQSVAAVDAIHQAFNTGGSLASVSPLLWAQLRTVDASAETTVRQQLEAIARQRATAAAGGAVREEKTDPVVFDRVLMDIRSGRRELDPARIPGLSPSDRRYFIKLRHAPPERIAAATLDQDTLRAIAHTAGLPAFATPAQTTPEARARLAQFESSVRERLEADQASKGRELTFAEKRAIMQEMATDTVLVAGGRWFSRDVTVPSGAVIQSDVVRTAQPRVPGLGGGGPTRDTPGAQHQQQRQQAAALRSRAIITLRNANEPVVDANIQTTIQNLMLLERDRNAVPLPLPVQRPR